MKDHNNSRERHIQDQIMDMLTNNLSDGQRRALDQHIAGCVQCQEELMAARHVWESLGKLPVPQPSAAMRTDFYAMLDQFAASEKVASPSWLHIVWEKICNMTIPQWSLQLGFSLLLVALGWAIGFRMGKPQEQAGYTPEQVAALAAQVQEMKSTVMLSLIENPSAAERLKAVGYTSEISADERVIDALFTTLDNDPNVNVRLVTLEALSQYASSPDVRGRLVKSLLRQDSPMIQAALADVMVQLQEKSAVVALKALLRKGSLDDLVKAKVEQSIRDLT